MGCRALPACHPPASGIIVPPALRWKGALGEPKVDTQFKAVVFDLDGTLADSLGEIADALNRALSDRGFPTHSLEAYRGMIGEGVENLVTQALPPSALGLLPNVISEYRSHYARVLGKSTRAYPGIDALLARLSASGFRLSVLSNKRDDFTGALVKVLFPRIGFVEVRGERDGVPRKPHPQAAVELSQAMKVSVEECLFVGDTRIDMQTATAAGMWPVGVLWGFRSQQELLAHGAKWLLRHPEELWTHLLG